MSEWDDEINNWAPWIALTILLFTAVMIADDQGIVDVQLPSIQLPSLSWPSTPSTPLAPTTPSTPSVKSAQLQFCIGNAINGTHYAASSGNIKVDIVKGTSPVSLVSVVDSITVNSAPEQSVMTYREGDIIILHVTCDGNAGTSVGTDHYDQWFGLKLGEGLPVYRLNKNCFQAVSGGYDIRLSSGEKTAHTVQWTPGTTNYFDIGSLGVYPRANKAYITFGAKYYATSLSSITDGTTFDTTTTGAKDATLLSDRQSLDITIDADASDISYGLPMLTVSLDGKIEERSTFLIMTTNMTKIGIGALETEGWHYLEDASLYAETGFYKKVPPMIPSRGSSVSWSCKLPIDASAVTADSGYYFKLHMSDFQLESSVAVGGMSLSIPTAYGMISEYGLDAIIYAKAFTTSSGCASGQVLSWVLDTAA